MKKTKIIGTLGPALDNSALLREVFEAGLDIVRLNFSHGSHTEHKARIDRVRRVADELQKACPIILDTKGPEIRIRELEGGVLTLHKGSEIRLAEGDFLGNAGRIAHNYPGLANFVDEGQSILIDDGLIALRVISKEGSDLVCVIENDAELKNNKSVNLPGINLDFPPLTEKDKDDIRFGIAQGLDFIAASFVRDASSVIAIRQFLHKNNGSHLGIIAKIENASAVEAIDEIIEASDGIMIARGDLGVEIPAEAVPHIQKDIIKRCNKAHKPVITATQMLDSMMRNPRPTRAEVADVANAIYDGSDCVMLSGETAAGSYPLQAVSSMARIAQETEGYLELERELPAVETTSPSVSLAVGISATRAAQVLKADAIVVPTLSGRSARLISSLRPNTPLYALSPSSEVVRAMQLYWGISPIHAPVSGGVQQVIASARDALLQQGLVAPGDICVFIAGDRSTAPQIQTEIVSERSVDEAVAPTNILQIIQIHDEV